jgi:molecular chaperone GrpE
MFHKQRQPNPDARKPADTGGESKTQSPLPAETPTPSGANASQPAVPATDEMLDPKLKEYLHQLEQLKAEKQELNDKYLRLGADYANYQKRVPRQVADSVAYEKKTFLKAILGPIDNFSHAMNNAETVTNSTDSAKSWVQGIRMVYQQLLDAMKSQGLERVPSVGRPFDPSVHEALTFRSEADKPDGIILEEYQPGYTFNGQSLRPSKVIVNKLAPVSTPEETTDDTDGADSEGK